MHLGAEDWTPHPQSDVLTFVITLTLAQRKWMRNELREARAEVLADLEAFPRVLFALERLGKLLAPKKSTLGEFRSYLLELAAESPLASELPSTNLTHRSFHTPAAVLFRLVKDGRNDALHQGVRVRHLSNTAVHFALVLEDALMNSDAIDVRVGDVMVRDVTVAEPWYPVAFVRQRMLEYAFSFVPIQIDGEWRLISDLALAKYVSSGSNSKRGERLSAAIETAINEGLSTYDSVQVATDCEIKCVLDQLDHCPALIFNDMRLVGIVTAFDLL